MEWLDFKTCAAVSSLAVAALSLAYSTTVLLQTRARLMRDMQNFAVSISPRDTALMMLGQFDPGVQSILDRNPKRVFLHVSSVGEEEAVIFAFGEEPHFARASFDLGERKDVAPLVRILQARGEFGEGEESWQTTKSSRRRPKASLVEIKELPFRSGDALHEGEKAVLTRK